MKDRIDVDGPEHLRSVYHRLRAPGEASLDGLNAGLTWKGSRGRAWITLRSMLAWFSVWLTVSYRRLSIGSS